MKTLNKWTPWIFNIHLLDFEVHFSTALLIYFYINGSKIISFYLFYWKPVLVNLMDWKMYLKLNDKVELVSLWTV